MSWRDARNDPREHPGGDLHHHQHRRRQHLQRPDLRQPHARPPPTRSRARRTSWARRRDNGRRPADNAVNATYGFGTSMGLAVYDGQLYPVWAGNFNEADRRQRRRRRPALSIFYRPMVIAAGPRIVSSTMGPIPLCRGRERRGQLHRHLRPADQPARRRRLVHPRRRPGLLPRHHQRRSLDPARGPERHAGRLQRRRPRQQVRLHRVHGHLRPRPPAHGGPSGIANYTGTYSYLIAPDDGSGNPIVSPIPSFVITDVPQPVIGPVASAQVPLPIPTSGTGGTRHRRRHHHLDDHTSRATTTRSSPASRSTCRSPPTGNERPGHHADGPRRPDRHGLPGHHRPARSRSTTGRSWSTA